MHGTIVSVLPSGQNALIKRVRARLSHALTQQPFFWGIGLMVLTTSLWALAFVAPLAIPDASAIEIALGRFIVYGLISAAAINLPGVLRLPWPILMRAVVFALAGNIAYYVLLVLGIQMAGAAMAVLIIGMLPVTVSICGQLGDDTSILKRMILPLCVFGIGVVAFNAGKTNFFSDLQAVSPLGLICIIASLIMWTWYALANADFLRRNKHISAQDWSSIIGLVSLVIALIGLPLAWSVGAARDPMLLSFGDLATIAVWSIILGAGATWLGTVLFNIASKLLTMALVGQLIIFEAVFGTIYVYGISGKPPSLLELAGISIALFAVWMSIQRLEKG